MAKVKVYAEEIIKVKKLLEHDVKEKDIAEILHLSRATVNRIAKGAYDWKLTGDKPSELYHDMVWGKSGMKREKLDSRSVPESAATSEEFTSIENKLNKLTELNSRMLTVMADILESTDAICRAWDIEKRRTYEEKADEQKEKANQPSNQVSY